MIGPPLGWGGAGWARLAQVRAYTFKEGSNHRESSGAQFTKLSLNTKSEPDAPKAHLGRDANPNMSMLVKTKVRTLANVNTTKNILESPQCTVLYLPLSPVPSERLCLPQPVHATQYCPLQHPKVLLSIDQIFSDLPSPKRKKPKLFSLTLKSPTLASPWITSELGLPPYTLPYISFISAEPLSLLCPKLAWCPHVSKHWQRLLHPPKLQGPALVPPAQTYMGLSLSRNTFLAVGIRDPQCRTYVINFFI